MVFPAFYGASYIPIAAGLKIPQDLAKELFDEFWKQFAVRKWQMLSRQPGTMNCLR